MSDDAQRASHADADPIRTSVVYDGKSVTRAVFDDVYRFRR